MMRPSKLIVEALGWYGFVVLLAAYAFVSFGIVPATSITFQLLNMSGSVGLAILTFYKKAYQNMILNIIWVGISSIAIFQIIMALK